MFYICILNTYMFVCVCISGMFCECLWFGLNYKIQLINTQALLKNPTYARYDLKHGCWFELVEAGQ